MFVSQPLAPSDVIEILGIIASLITSVIAIVISVKTLHQNSQMIEESTRPYIVVYSQTTNFQSPAYYLIIKNFGQTGAIVTSIRCNHDLSLYSFSQNHIPFEHFNGTFVAPGQTFLCSVNTQKLFENPESLHFSVEYESNGKTYSDSFEINLNADSDLVQVRAATNGKELRNISYTLQDLVEKQL